MSGVKHDTGKLRFDLLPVKPLMLLAEVYTIGARKYTDRNWEKGISWGRIFAALMRHAWAWWDGEERDPVDGQHHLASVAWCALALMEYEETHRELDDRPHRHPVDIGDSGGGHGDVPRRSTGQERNDGVLDGASGLLCETGSGQAGITTG